MYFWVTSVFKCLIVFRKTSLLIPCFYVIFGFAYLFVHLLLNICCLRELIRSHYQSADKKLAIGLLSFDAKEKLQKAFPMTGFHFLKKVPALL
jgi:hypothetical protein